MQRALLEILERLSMSGLTKMEAYFLLVDFVNEYEELKNIEKLSI